MAVTAKALTQGVSLARAFAGRCARASSELAQGADGAQVGQAVTGAQQVGAVGAQQLGPLGTQQLGGAGTQQVGAQELPQAAPRRSEQRGGQGWP